MRLPTATNDCAAVDQKPARLGCQQVMRVNGSKRARIDDRVSGLALTLSDDSAAAFQQNSYLLSWFTSTDKMVAMSAELCNTQPHNEYGLAQ